jgi:polysaccharide deacetylase family protein (PEP-CTERM system associated)
MRSEKRCSKVKSVVAVGYLEFGRLGPAPRHTAKEQRVCSNGLAVGGIVGTRNTVAGSVAKPAAIFSVDVEDWFHILDIHSAPALADWSSMPSRVERNFYHLLELFSTKNVRTTCFFLGWVGERFPHLVREAAAQGHEIASHGYAHRLAYQMSAHEFYTDANRSRQILEDISGSPVWGYRAAGFSQNEESPWFFDQLSKAGYYYDASVFPAKRCHGGMHTALRSPYVVGGGDSQLVEFPMTVAGWDKKPTCFFGGGYLRLFPYWLIRKMAHQVLADGRPVIFYVHPREIDPDHPRLPMSLSRRFKSYVNLNQTEQKILRILDDFSVVTFCDYLCPRKGPAKVAALDFSSACERLRVAGTSRLA